GRCGCLPVLDSTTTVINSCYAGAFPVSFPGLVPLWLVCSGEADDAIARNKTSDPRLACRVCDWHRDGRDGAVQRFVEGKIRPIGVCGIKQSASESCVTGKPARVRPGGGCSRSQVVPIALRRVSRRRCRRREKRAQSARRTGTASHTWGPVLG